MSDAETDWLSWLNERGPALLLYARQWLPDRAAAEDAVQEAFVRFWKARGRAGDPAAYLFACVRSCALEALRSQQRRDRREQAAARPDRQEPLFDASLHEQERHRAIEAALAQLPDEQREVVVLKVWGGLAFPAIAEALGVPANTAASRYRYALEKLRQHLTAEAVA
jgi:RNA polymerase sigma-70 factor (ECF subfamily)